MYKENPSLTAQEVVFNHKKLIGNCEAGDIYTVRLGVLKLAKYQFKNPKIPYELSDTIGRGVDQSEKHRRGMVEKLKKNSPNPFPVIGKPSSAFMIHDGKGNVRLDYLLEDENFQRDPRKTLHSYMTEYDNNKHLDRYHPHNLFRRKSLWSGHLACLTPGFRTGDYCYVFLFDKFERKSTIMDEEDKFVTKIAHVNEIIPLTADGKIISFPKNSTSN